MTEDNLLIHYFLIISDDIKTLSPFAAFNQNLYPYNDVIPIIQRFPLDIFELGKNDYSMFDYRYRVCRGHKIITLMYDNYVKYIPTMKFSCIIYDSEKFPKLKSICKNWEVQPYYIELNNINNIKNDDFYNHFVKEANTYLNSIGINYSFKLEPPLSIDSNIIIDTLIKNMMPTFIIKGSREELQQKIIIANNLLKNTLALGNHSSKYIDLIITSVPIIKNKKLEEIFLSKINENEKLSTKHLLNQKDYINDTIISENNSYFNDRYNEVYMYITCMKIVFENYHAPIIQLEPGIQTNTNMYLTNINKSKTKEKKLKTYRAFLDVVNNYYSIGFYEFIPTNKIPRIKIYSDGPAEFVSHPTENLPLLISSNICKIPMTPGVALFNHISSLSDTYISYSDLSNILIIRSFKEDTDEDKLIKYSFENRLKSTNQLTNLNIRIVDVNNSTDVINTLNTNTNYNVRVYGYLNSDNKLLENPSLSNTVALLNPSTSPVAISNGLEYDFLYNDVSFKNELSQYIDKETTCNGESFNGWWSYKTDGSDRYMWDASSDNLTRWKIKTSLYMDHVEDSTKPHNIPLTIVGGNPIYKTTLTGMYEDLSGSFTDKDDLSKLNTITVPTINYRKGNQRRSNFGFQVIDAINQKLPENKEFIMPIIYKPFFFESFFFKFIAFLLFKV